MENKTINKHQEPKLQDKSSKIAGEPEKEAKIIELIVFNLGDEEFAANIDQVREIIRKGTITPIPDSPDFIKGVTNVRGEITVVIDLKARFFLSLKKEVESKHIVITEQDKNLFGLMVDEVTEVLRIHENDVKETPALVTRIDKVYVSGVITLQNRLIILIDLAKVLSEEELIKLSELRVKRRVGAESETDVKPQREKKEAGKEGVQKKPKKPDKNTLKQKT